MRLNRRGIAHYLILFPDKDMLRTKLVFALSFYLLLALAASAKEAPQQEIIWPASGTPVLRFSFGKFKEISSSGKQRVYNVDTTTKNVWSKTISKADFFLYVFDKDKVRVAEGYISVSNLAPGE